MNRISNAFEEIRIFELITGNMHTKKVEIKHISIQLGCRNRDSTERSRWQPSGNKTIFLADRCFEDRLKRKKDELYRPLKLPQGECKDRWWAAHKNDGQDKLQVYDPNSTGSVALASRATPRKGSNLLCCRWVWRTQYYNCWWYSGIYSAIGCLIIMFDMWCLLYWAI